MESKNLKQYEHINDEFTTDYLSEYNSKSSLEETSRSETMRKFYQENFRYTKWRWVVLVSISFSIFGSYYWYDIPNICKKQIRKNITHEEDDDYIKFDLLYAVSGYVSMILSLFGGVVIDHIGLRASYILFSIILTLGQIIFMISTIIHSQGNAGYIVALMGRFVFGIGKNCLIIWKSVAVSDWFIGQELGLAYGITISVSRIGIVTSQYLTPIFAEVDLWLACFIGVILCILSLGSCILFGMFQKHSDKLAAMQFESEEIMKEKFECKYIRKIDKRFWMICMIVLFLYISKVNLLIIVSDLFHIKYSKDHAEYYASILVFATILFWPIIGIIIDKIGHQMTIMVIGCITWTWSFTLFLWLPADDKTRSLIGILPLIVFGISYCMYSVWTWTSIPLVVMPSALGTGFGIAVACENFGLAFSPLILNTFIKEDSFDKYDNLMILFIITSSIATLFSIILFVMNWLHVRKQKSQIQRYEEYNKRLNDLNKDEPDKLIPE